jgi:hypothetical protein
MPPTTASEIQSFLGLAGYYRQFIKDFSKIAKPMMKLLEKTKAFEWTTKEMSYFNTGIGSTRFDQEVQHIL